MRRLTLIASVFILLLASLAVFSQQDQSSGQSIDVQMSQPEVNNMVGMLQRVDAQVVLEFPDLSVAEIDTIDKYLLKHPGLKGVNYVSTRAALKKLRALKVIHFPLTESPKEYMKEIQVIEQTLKYLKIYFYQERKEACKPLPAFQRLSSAGELVLDSAPDVVPPTPCRKAPVAPVCKPKACVGATTFGKSERSNEAPIGILSKEWSKSSSEKEEEPETCPPGTAPTPPPPNSGQVTAPGNPSGSIPDPPATDINQPGTSGNHGTGGAPQDPGPNGKNTADPVT